MRGHQPLIAMRLRGKCPAGAIVTVGTDPAKAWADWPTSNPWAVIAQLEVPERDRLSALAADFRCLVGLVVQVVGHDQDRTSAVAQMVMEAGAKRVFVFTHNPNSHAVESAAYITEDMQQWQPF